MYECGSRTQCVNIIKGVQDCILHQPVISNENSCLGESPAINEDNFFPFKILDYVVRNPLHLWLMCLHARKNWK